MRKMAEIKNKLRMPGYVLPILFTSTCLILIVLSGLAITDSFRASSYLSSYVQASTMLAQFVGNNGLLFWSIDIAIFAIGLIFARRIRIENEERPDTSGRRANFAIVTVSMAIIAASVTAIVVSRLRYTLPSGGDILVYVDYVRVIQANGPSWAVQMTDRPLFYLLLYVMAQAFDVRSPTFWAGTAGSVSAAFLISTWYLLVKADPSRWRVSAFVVVAATAVSPLFMRLNADIFSSELGLAVALFMFGVYLSSKSLRPIHKIALVALSVCLLMLYWYLLLVSILGLSVIAVVQHRRLRELAGVLTPAMSAFALFIAFAVLFPPPQYWGIGSAVVGLFAHRGLPPWIPTNLPSAPLRTGPSSESIILALGSRDLVFMGLMLAGIAVVSKI